MPSNEIADALYTCDPEVVTQGFIVALENGIPKEDMERKKIEKALIFYFSKVKEEEF